MDPGTFILTKIIATVGPACDTQPTLVRLIEEGVRVFRINFSHGQPADHLRMLSAIRAAAKDAGTPIAVLGDLSGPKIRVGQVRKSGIELQPGDNVVFQRKAITARDKTFSTTYPKLIDEAQIGHRLLIDDGAIRMLVIDRTGSGDKAQLHCRVIVGGLVTTAKGINLPDTDLSVESLTDYDRRCVDWAIQHDLDFLALSFVRSSDDIRKLKELLVEKGGRRNWRMPVLAKIEKPQALDDLEAILHESDAVMVARGDLGVEMDLAQVPIIQKRIISKAHEFGRPVIVATQMLQSMIDAASPTRAEVSDVANAIFDAADAVMLSGETAVGKHPIQAVAMMARIAVAMQEHVGKQTSQWSAPAPGRVIRRDLENRYRTAALAHGVAAVVRDLGARFIVVWSQRGGAARYVSGNRPTIPILAASSEPVALRRMCPLFGVQPVYMPQPRNIEDFIDQMDAMLLERQWAQPGDPVVIVAGEPIGTVGVTNSLRIHYVGDVCSLPAK